MDEINEAILCNSKVSYICVTLKLHVMERTICHTWLFEHPKELVWEYLTNSELIAQWLMANDFKPIVGHKFMFDTKPKVKVGFDGKVYGEVLEVRPYQLLSYSWKGGPGNGKITLDSVVTWTLAAKGNRTELTLEHAGFKGLRNFLAYFFMNAGWNGKIKKRLGELMDQGAHERAKA